MDSHILSNYVIIIFIVCYCGVNMNVKVVILNVMQNYPLLVGTVCCWQRYHDIYGFSPTILASLHCLYVHYNGLYTVYFCM